MEGKVYEWTSFKGKFVKGGNPSFMILIPKVENIGSLEEFNFILLVECVQYNIRKPDKKV